MVEKRVSVRLAAVGGRQVRAELEGVGEAGSRGFGRLSREMEAANARLAGFARRVKVASAAAVAAATAAGVAMVRSGLQSVDAQAKLAQSLGTTVESIQTLERAGELAGVAMSGIEQATKDLTRRLSQAAAGGGPAADALERLGLTASDLLALPLDKRVGAINAAIEDFVPVAERAAVAGQLFGEEGSIAMSRIDTATLRQATEDVLAFGVVVSEQDADQIERTNDAISRLGLIWRGLSNQLAVAAAPALEAVADAMAAVASRTGPLGQAIRGLFDNIGRLTSYAATFATFLAGRWVAGMAAAALSVRGLATALVVLRGALVRTGIGALIVGAGELVHQFTRLVQGAGGFGNALGLLANVGRAAFSEIGTLGKALVASLGGAAASIAKAFVDGFAWIGRKWAEFCNWMLTPFNTVMEALGRDFRLQAISPIEGVTGALSDWLGAQADAMHAVAGEVLEGATRTREAVAALGAVLKGSEEAQVSAPALDLGQMTAVANDVSTALSKAGKAGGSAGKAIGTGADMAADALRKTEDAAEAAGQRLEEAGKSLAEDTLGPMKAALKQGELNWKSFASVVAGIAQNLAGRLIDAAFRPIETAILNAFTGGGGNGLTGLLASFFGFAKGGVFDQGRELAAFARGGVIDRPVVFPFAKGIGLAGEAGPEAILPLRRGRGGRLGVEVAGDGAAVPQMSTRIINVIDPSLFADYVATPAGERAIVNVIRRNRGVLNA
ncbi:phage tail tape measure protein [Amaricoccus macauensis]|uniref:phage tail tape measure protein n=1 Tax=Amaricoccus macauensis TaxID=57001 RepID=UPI003C7AE55A